VVQRQPWPPALCGPHRRPRLVATFAIRCPPRKFMIAAAALTTSQVLTNISSACIQMRPSPDRPAHRQPRPPRRPTRPRLPANPYRASLTTGAANRERVLPVGDERHFRVGGRAGRALEPLEVGQRTTDSFRNLVVSHRVVMADARVPCRVDGTRGPAATGSGQ
jgi:hypothetical protein